MTITNQSLSKQRIEGNKANFPAVEHQGQRLAGAIGFDAGVFAPAFDHSWFAVDENAVAEDVDNPIDRDRGPGVFLESRGKVVLKAGDGDFDEQADILRAGVTVGGDAAEEVARANDGEVG